MKVDANVAGYACFSIAMFLTGGYIPLFASLAIAFVGRLLFDKFANIPVPIPPKSAVLITGCSSGIGEDIAIDLAKNGVCVFAGVRKIEDGEKLKKRVNNSNIIPIIIDVAKKEQIDDAYKLVEQSINKLGLSLFAIINNAGYTETSVLELITLEKLRKQFEVNIHGHIYVTNQFLPLIRKYKHSTLTPRIIFISSGLSKMSFPNLGSYCATKYAIEAITDAYRMELVSWNIDVISVQPGSIKTNFQHVSLDCVKENVLSDSSSKQNEDKVKSHYNKAINLMIEKKTVMDRIITTTEETTKVLKLSLTEPKPRTRYTVGTDATYLLPFAITLPFRIRDAIFGRFFQ